MAEIKAGDLVRFVEKVDFDPTFHPRYGAVGKAVDVDSSGVWVAWECEDLPEECWREYRPRIESGEGLYCSSFRLEVVKDEGGKEMGEIKAGDWVQLTSNDGPDDDYHPRIGAVGEVIRVDGDGDPYVAWDAEDFTERVREVYENTIKERYGMPCSRKYVELYCSKGRAIGDWLRERTNDELAEILSDYVDCDTCSRLKQKYGITLDCSVDGCRGVWKYLLSKELKG